PFVVGEKSRTKKGSGLGLAISKKIIDAHGGSISIVEPRENYKFSKINICVADDGFICLIPIFFKRSSLSVANIPIKYLLSIIFNLL
ncbi:ATP-binding protein, partial [Terrisporobacter muris]|nr:hypothetical protein [Terrisporobacter muris]